MGSCAQLLLNWKNFSNLSLMSQSDPFTARIVFIFRSAQATFPCSTRTALNLHPRRSLASIAPQFHQLGSEFHLEKLENVQQTTNPATTVCSTRPANTRTFSLPCSHCSLTLLVGMSALLEGLYFFTHTQAHGHAHTYIRGRAAVYRSRVLSRRVGRLSRNHHREGTFSASHGKIWFCRKINKILP